MFSFGTRAVNHGLLTLLVPVLKHFSGYADRFCAPTKREITWQYTSILD
jgi:hypothetical protein